MKSSNFIITTKEDNQVVLYSTITTALIVISIEDYEQVFCHHIFQDTGLVQQLYQCGFLIDDDFDEVGLLEQLRKKDVEKPLPVITIYTTTNCNARCYYCFEKGIHPVDMTSDTASQVVRFIKKTFKGKRIQIMWFGGEPLMNFGIIEQVTTELYREGYELLTHITTNGSLLTKEMLSFFKSYYSKISIQITIDEIHDAYAKIKRYTDIPAELAFKRVVDNCKLIIDAQIYLSIRINYLEQNYNRATQIFEEIEQIFTPFDHHQLNIYLAPITLESGCNSCLSEVDDSFKKVIKFHREHNVMNIRAKDDDQQVLSSFCLLPKSGSCGAHRRNNIVVRADGMLFKCHRLANDDVYNVGNIYDGINYHSKYYTQFVTHIMTDETCAKCNVLPLCQGGCSVIKMLYNRNMECDIKNVQESMLRDYFHYLIEQK